MNESGALMFLYEGAGCPTFPLPDVLVREQQREKEKGRTGEPPPSSTYNYHVGTTFPVPSVIQIPLNALHHPPPFPPPPTLPASFFSHILCVFILVVHHIAHSSIHLYISGRLTSSDLILAHLILATKTLRQFITPHSLPGLAVGSHLYFFLFFEQKNTLSTKDARPPSIPSPSKRSLSASSYAAFEFSTHISVLPRSRSTSSRSLDQQLLFPCRAPVGRALLPGPFGVCAFVRARHSHCQASLIVGA
ncbi:hypothetical protein ACRALDRAFT_208965 [Sodiomyces alcalophilus JCM 7366]|uniref:uncharacterized protein n=1 Tax=Sodiomyces alcalophilus JCM 7366 TaxID=591952 RepID=UPI0039B553F6